MIFLKSKECYLYIMLLMIRTRVLSAHNRYPSIHLGCLARPKFYKLLPKRACSSCEMHLVDNLLKNKTSIRLNLAEYRLLLANSAYGLVG